MGSCPHPHGRALAGRALSPARWDSPALLSPVPRLLSPVVFLSCSQEAGDGDVTLLPLGTSAEPSGDQGQEGLQSLWCRFLCCKEPLAKAGWWQMHCKERSRAQSEMVSPPVPILSPGSRFTPGVSPIAGRAVGERLLLRASRAGGSHTGNCTGLWESKQVGWALGLWAQERSFALPYLSTGLLESPFWGAAPMPP